VLYWGGIGAGTAFLIGVLWYFGTLFIANRKYVRQGSMTRRPTLVALAVLLEGVKA